MSLSMFLTGCISLLVKESNTNTNIEFLPVYCNILCDDNLKNEQSSFHFVINSVSEVAASMGNDTLCLVKNKVDETGKCNAVLKFGISSDETDSDKFTIWQGMNGCCLEDATVDIELLDFYINTDGKATVNSNINATFDLLGRKHVLICKGTTVLNRITPPEEGFEKIIPFVANTTIEGDIQIMSEDGSLLCGKKLDEIRRLIFGVLKKCPRFSSKFSITKNEKAVSIWTSRFDVTQVATS